MLHLLTFKHSEAQVQEFMVNMQVHFSEVRALLLSGRRMLWLSGAWMPLPGYVASDTGRLGRVGCHQVPIAAFCPCYKHCTVLIFLQQRTVNEMRTQLLYTLIGKHVVAMTA